MPKPWHIPPLGSSDHGIILARRLDLVAIHFSRGSSHSRDWTQVSWIAGRFFTLWSTREGPLSDMQPNFEAFTFIHTLHPLLDISPTSPHCSQWWIYYGRENRTLKYPSSQESQHCAFMGDSSMSRNSYLPKWSWVFPSKQLKSSPVKWIKCKMSALSSILFIFFFSALLKSSGWESSNLRFRHNYVNSSPNDLR